MELSRKYAEYKWWFIPVSIIALFYFVLYVLYGAAISRWIEDNRPETIIATTDAGFAISADFIDGLTHNKTRVETDRGVYLVTGTFQITKGQQLVLQEQRSGHRLLCEKGGQNCNYLAK